MELSELQEIDLPDYLNEKFKEQLRKYSKDSSIYQAIGKKCYFCKQIISEKEAVYPNRTFTSEQGHTVHEPCLNYIQTKYPNTKITELEGSIQRIKNDF